MSDDRQWHFTRASSPAVFWLSALAAGVVALALWGVAWYLHFHRRVVGAPGKFLGKLSRIEIIMLSVGALVLFAAWLVGWFV